MAAMGAISTYEPEPEPTPAPAPEPEPKSLPVLKREPERKGTTKTPVSWTWTVARVLERSASKSALLPLRSGGGAMGGASELRLAPLPLRLGRRRSSTEPDLLRPWSSQTTRDHKHIWGRGRNSTVDGPDFFVAKKPMAEEKRRRRDRWEKGPKLWRSSVSSRRSVPSAKGPSLLAMQGSARLSNPKPESGPAARRTTPPYPGPPSTRAPLPASVRSGLAAQVQQAGQAGQSAAAGVQLGKGQTAAVRLVGGHRVPTRPRGVADPPPPKPLPPERTSGEPLWCWRPPPPLLPPPLLPPATATAT